MAKVSEYLVEMVVWVIGWLFCFAMLCGAYGFGRWVAPHLGWTENADVAGILSALTFIWIYEHRNLEDKNKRLWEALDRVR